MGYVSPQNIGDIRRKKPHLYRAYPITRKTSNDKLQLAARSLELIFTVPNWPPGAGVLTTSLKESGKSRADLWQFAGNVALEKAINRTNTAICNDLQSRKGLQLSPSDDADKCEIKLNRPIPFRSGRIDCVPDESVKWTPYPFEATKTEKHSNTFGTGTQVVKDLKEDFDFTAQETISLMSLHGLARHVPNFEQFTKYKWIGGVIQKGPDAKKGILHRLYYKILNGKRYRMGYEYLNGDKNGNPVGGPGFWIDCKGHWNNTDRKFPGPCHFRPTQPGN